MPFVSRCIPIVISEGTTNNSSQAAAICHNIWQEHREKNMKTTIQKNKKPFYATKDFNPVGEIKLGIHDVDSFSRKVAVILNTANYFDSDMDVLMPGCAKKSIAERGVYSTAPAKIKHCLFHDLTRLPGKWVELSERKIQGMDVIFGVSKLADTTEGNDTLKNYLAEIYDNHSIGYKYIIAKWLYKNLPFTDEDLRMMNIDREAMRKEWDECMANVINREDAESAGHVYCVKEIALYEGSTVSFGSNPLTQFLGFKSKNKQAVLFDCLAKIDKIETSLVKGTQSDEMLQVLSLQCLQLKQMVSDMIELQPAEKKENTPPGNLPASKAEKKLDLKKVAQNFSLK